MKKILFSIIIAIISVSSAIAQQNSVDLSFGGDLVSTYVWRGQQLGDVAIQPWATISHEKSGLSLTAWASAEVNRPTNMTDFDLILEWSKSNITIGIQDYFFPCQGQSKYWTEWTSKSYTHYLEGHLGYDFGPLAINWYTVLLGGDFKSNGDRNFSSYAEISAPWKLGNIEGNAAIGATPWDDYFTNAAGHEHFSITNISVRANRSLIDDKLSLFGQIVFNPQSEKTYFVVGLSF